jgi:glycerophosphoryl diester phosphodiesterase
MRLELDIQGHRGARGLLPENTLPAFRKALELGVTTLEMDVVISADHEVVVSHEPWMSAEICTRPDGRPVSPEEEHSLRIFAMPYEEVIRFDCGMRRPKSFPGQRSVPAVKPLLRDVIEMAEHTARVTGRPPVQYSIETKSRRRWDGEFHPGPRLFTELLYSVLHRQGVVERSIVQSFDLRTLREARAMAPHWRTARIPRLNIVRLGFVPYVYSPHHYALSARLVRRVHQLGMTLIPWTLNSDLDIEQAIQLGADGIITDYPDRARRVVQRLAGS